MKQYWDEHYEKFRIIEPSKFARFVQQFLEMYETVLDLGCGNGRDSQFFYNLDTVSEVRGCDSSSKALDLCDDHIDKFYLDVTKDTKLLINLLKRSSIIYCRFLLHALPPKNQISLLHTICESINMYTKVFIECRSETYEYIDYTYGEHERYLVNATLITNIFNNYGITNITDVQKNRAIFKNEDPPIIWSVGIKQ